MLPRSNRRDAGVHSDVTRRVPKTSALKSRHGVARVISKLGLGSRTQATRWVTEGRVKVNGKLVKDAEFPTTQGVDRISIDGIDTSARQRIVIMLNKPRGLVTTTSDEQGRDTVYKCLAESGLPWLAPVGRLDKASEGLLLFSNDPVWAARVTDPATGPTKTYHVQVSSIPDDRSIASLEQGTEVDGEHLAAKTVRRLRAGERNAWLEIVLEEGRNRQIRRLLTTFDLSVLRLVRVAVGSLSLGTLPKGQWRHVSQEEAVEITPPSPARPLAPT
jgi:23S rRNA pseudouridine2605 synthase